MLHDDEAHGRLHRLGRPLRFDVGYLLVGAVCLPAIWPILGPNLFASTDGLYHLSRLVDLDFCIRGWALYPRWLPNLAFAYGYPVLNYYAPLAYYLAELLHLLGSGFVSSIELTFVIGFLLSAVFMYLYVKEILGRECGFAAAAAYVYLPGHLSDCYIKGALAECFAFAFLPLILWAFHRLILRRQARYLPLAAASYAALVLTYNLSALTFAPLLIAYVCFLLALGRDIKMAVHAFSALLLALALSAFFWLPGLLEYRYVLAEQVRPTAAECEQQLVAPGELVLPSVIYRYYPDDVGGTGLPLSLIEIGLAGLSVVLLIGSRNVLNGAARYHLLFFIGASLLALFMMATPSSFLWRGLPFLPYLQYPGRLLLLATISNAVLIGSSPLLTSLADDRPVSTPKGKTRVWRLGLAALATAMVVMVAHLGRLAVEPMRFPGRDVPLTEETVDLTAVAEVDYVVAVMTRLFGHSWGQEYLPVWMQVPREEYFLPVQDGPVHPQRHSQPVVPTVVLGKQGPLTKALRIHSGSQTQLSFHTFYYPGWKFFIDGEEARTFPSGPLGLVTADIGPGEHEILLLFTNTPSRTMGTLVSLAGVSAVVVAGLVLAKRKVLVLIPLVSVIALIPLLWCHVRAAPSVQYPTSREATLANQVKLLGYYVDTTSYRPGDTIELTLYWLALQEMDKDYKVFVHLTDEGMTRLIAQSDRWPVYNFSPTTRWQPGEIVWDRHEIEIPADAGPGTYKLSTGMYLLETMRNLDVLDENGAPMGVSATLSPIEIGP